MLGWWLPFNKMKSKESQSQLEASDILKLLVNQSRCVKWSSMIETLVVVGEQNEKIFRSKTLELN